MPKEFSLIQRLIPLAVALIIVLTVVELIRRRKLREEYAMLWLIASAVLVVFAIFPRLLWQISAWLGVYYLTVLIIACVGFLSLMAIHFAIAISRLNEDTRQVAQKLALLEQKLSQLPGGQDQEKSDHDETI